MVDLYVTAQTLADNIHRLPTGKQDFARSLIDHLNTRGRLSDKQAPWLGKLLEMATAPAPRQVTVGDIKGIIALFDRARRNLKRPAVVLHVDTIGLVRIAPTGGATRYPGALNVTAYEHGPDGREWHGRIEITGEFTESRKSTVSTAALTSALRQFAADPAKIAANHGRLTGRCCFCHRQLADERSTAVGYGKICADHYGLPWGN